MTGGSDKEGDIFRSVFDAADVTGIRYPKHESIIDADFPLRCHRYARVSKRNDLSGACPPNSRRETATLRECPFFRTSSAPSVARKSSHHPQ